MEEKIVIDIGPTKGAIDKSKVSGILVFDKDLPYSDVVNKIEKLDEKLLKTNNPQLLVFQGAKYHDLANRDVIEVKQKVGDVEVSAVYTSEKSLDGSEVCDIVNKLLNALEKG